jgi:hypothetical protein
MRSAGVPGRALAILTALAVALVLAFVFAPPMLAANASESGLSDRRELVRTANGAFIEYWRSGDRAFTPGMQRLVDYWFRFHVAKAAITAVLLIVLIALCVLLWKAFLSAGRLGAGKAAAFASAGVLVTILVVVSVVALVANVQGAVAPFTSVLTLLPVGTSRGRLGDTFQQVRQRLAEYRSTGHQTSPALHMMIDDNVRYHVAVVVMASILALVLIGTSVLLWKRFTGSSGRRTRRTLASFGTAAAVFSLLFAALAVVNLTVADKPALALVNFFNGSM